MDATAYNRSSRIQARFTGFMLVVGCVLLAMVLLACAAIYFTALWATGLKLRQFLRR